jgi:hypothetical protein
VNPRTLAAAAAVILAALVATVAGAQQKPDPDPALGPQVVPLRPLPVDDPDRRAVEPIPPDKPRSAAHFRFVLANERRAHRAQVRALRAEIRTLRARLADRDRYRAEASRYRAQFLCIARHESGLRWSINTGNGYYGGLQMDRAFQRTYGPELYRHGTADTWTVDQQIAVASRAVPRRGFTPWPTTARICGLL